ncbi:hypothetical protein QAD02_010879 [Eretmocerus hayati]|uniref:Uncharacterized protein n=1 Tax=Eretmocerus hayati TaxID=131215 RepID=A0ACC2NW66_9HYME|nr:hypothetical protein QAD02_010879 [Eretmocerus hayati]
MVWLGYLKQDVRFLSEGWVPDAILVVATSADLKYLSVIEKKLNCEMRGLPKREDLWKYLKELIDLHDNPTAKIKKVGVTHYLVANGKEIKVCQTMFNDTFGNDSFQCYFGKWLICDI